MNLGDFNCPWLVWLCCFWCICNSNSDLKVFAWSLARTSLQKPVDKIGFRYLCSFCRLFALPPPPPTLVQALQRRRCRMPSGGSNLCRFWRLDIRPIKTHPACTDILIVLFAAMKRRNRCSWHSWVMCFDSFIDVWTNDKKKKLSGCF